MIKLDPKTTELKVGMKVMLRSDLKADNKYDGVYFTNKMNVNKGKTVKIKKIDEDRCDCFHLDKYVGGYGYSAAMIDYIIGEDMTKDDLSNGDIVKLRNGDILVICGGEIRDIKNNSYFENADVFNNNLKHKTYKKNDIIAVAKYTEHNWTWQRTEPKEVTMAEVCEKFGYDVKIVKENNNG